MRIRVTLLSWLARRLRTSLSKSLCWARVGRGFRCTSVYTYMCVFKRGEMWRPLPCEAGEVCQANRNVGLAAASLPRAQSCLVLGILSVPLLSEFRLLVCFRSLTSYHRNTASSRMMRLDGASQHVNLWQPTYLSRAALQLGKASCKADYTVTRPPDKLTGLGVLLGRMIATVPARTKTCLQPIYVARSEGLNLATPTLFCG